jgi:hypothetical protein
MSADEANTKQEGMGREILLETNRKHHWEHRRSAWFRLPLLLRGVDDQALPSRVTSLWYDFREVAQPSHNPGGWPIMESEWVNHGSFVVFEDDWGGNTLEVSEPHRVAACVRQKRFFNYLRPAAYNAAGYTFHVSLGYDIVEKKSC